MRDERKIKIKTRRGEEIKEVEEEAEEKGGC